MKPKPKEVVVSEQYADLVERLRLLGGLPEYKVLPVLLRAADVIESLLPKPKEKPMTDDEALKAIACGGDGTDEFLAAFVHVRNKLKERWVPCFATAAEKPEPLWHEFVNKDGLCGLCSNTGRVCFVQPVPEGKLCICPIGRALKTAELDT